MIGSTDLSVIIVNYNTRDLTLQCLRSVFVSRTNFRFEVLVSDNGSVDGSADAVRREFPQAVLIENHANLGFSKGNNVALRQAGGRYCLLLNSDTTVRENTFDASVRYMDAHPGVGILGAKVLLPDGSLDPACRRRFPNPVNSFLRLFGLKRFSDYNVTGPVDQEMSVDCVMGAYLMIRREAIERVGLLDEAYFMYGEDIDWCWRVRKAGYDIRYVPAAEITHFKYGSSRTIPYRVVVWAHEAMRIFYRKHYAPAHPWIFNQLVYAGIRLRQYLVMGLNLFRNKKSVH